MFYDAYGNGEPEDLEIAEKIMKKRISIAGKDIKLHHKYYSEFLNLFYDIDENINTNNREKVAEKSNDLVDRIKAYIFRVVDNHNSKLKENAFLTYPSCYIEYGFHIQGSDTIDHLAFNLNSDYLGAKKDLNKITKLLSSFSSIKERIPIYKIATQEDTGIGIMDTSLRGRYELNIELLRRIGFELENLK